MSPEGPLDRKTVYFFRTGPALRRPQDYHRPGGSPLQAVLADISLNCSNFGIAGVERGRKCLVNDTRIAAFDEIRFVAPAPIELGELFVRSAGLDCRAGYLIAIKVQDREDGAITNRIEEHVPLPASFQRAGFRFAVADHTGDDQLRVVKGGSKRMHQRVTQLSTLVYRVGNV